MNDSRLKWMLVISSMALWAFAVYQWYHIVHEPFADSFMPATLDRPANLAMWMTLLLLAAAPGRRVLRSTLEARSAAELVLSVGLRVGVLLCGAPLLGTTGILVGWLSRAPFVVLLGVHPWDIGRIPRTLRKAWQWKRRSKPSLLQTSFSCTTFLPVGVSALTPPREWDALQYHITGPNPCIEESRQAGIPVNSQPLCARAYPPAGQSERVGDSCRLLAAFYEPAFRRQLDEGLSR